jgi:hypothetical protein
MTKIEELIERVATAHGAELIGASGMCRAWADGIEEIEEDV